jgi:Type VI secretion system effector, Hcp
MKKFLLLSILLISNLVNAQIGIGTNTPSANAVLDVNSTNKGLMLPRLNNTAAVSSPTAGLMIYDKSNNAPALHDGTQWNKMMMMPMPSVVGTDSLSYAFLVGFGPLFLINNPLPLQSMSMGGSYPGGPSPVSWQDFNFVKSLDRNTIGFLNLFGNKSIATSTVIEIKVFKKGTSLHYFSYKFTNLIVSSVSFGASTGGTGNYEQYSIQPKIYGWKDNVSGFSIGFDTTTGLQVAY